MRFLLSRRWVGLFLAVVVVALACARLGVWQFHRYDERHRHNAVTEANLKGDPLPVEQVMRTDSAPRDDDEWRTVSATGAYDAGHQVVVRYRIRDGAPGVDVVVPLVTASGTALLVDRGWVASRASGSQQPDLPPLPEGQVTVTGWVRQNAEGGETKLSDSGVRAISSDAIGGSLPYDVYDGFIDLTDERPTTSPSPKRAAAPDLGAGPSFFYGLQWFFFALLAFGFWCYFAWAEYKQEPQDREGVTARE